MESGVRQVQKAGFNLFNGADSLAYKDLLLYMPHNMEDVVSRAGEEGSMPNDWIRRYRFRKDPICTYGLQHRGKDRK